MSYTYTYALLPLSRAAYDEIAAKLRAAGYDQAFHEDDIIDMHGIAVQPEGSPCSQRGRRAMGKYGGWSDNPERFVAGSGGSGGSAVSGPDTTPARPNVPVREALEGVNNLVKRCHGVAHEVTNLHREIAAAVDVSFAAPAGASGGPMPATTRPEPRQRSVQEMLDEIVEGLCDLEARLQCQSKALDILLSRL